MNYNNKQVHLFEVKPRGIYIKFSRLSFSSDVISIYLEYVLVHFWVSFQPKLFLPTQRFYDSIEEEIRDSTFND